MPAAAATTAFVTIVARNYLGQALTMLESLRTHHPTSARYAFVIDGPTGQSAAALRELGAIPLAPEDVAIPDFRRLVFGYDVVEACTAVKPFVLRMLLARGHPKVIYLDPDIMVFAPLDAALGALDRHDVVLTPHALTPFPPEAPLNDEQLLRVGGCNLGFVGVNTAGDGFLRWWGARLERRCLNQQDRALFVDQKWVDLAPLYFDGVTLLRHRGYNLAYWNLHERRLRPTAHGHVVVETGEPLVFVHFSSLDPADVDAISATLVRIGAGAGYRLADREDLRAVFEAYAAVYRRHAAWRREEYGFSRFRDGRPIRAAERRRYLATPALQEAWPDPFAAPPGVIATWCPRRGRASLRLVAAALLRRVFVVPAARLLGRDRYAAAFYGLVKHLRPPAPDEAAAR